jgi:predicted SAM-dependent methyltransferase
MLIKPLWVECSSSAAFGGGTVRVVIGAGTVYEEGWIRTNVQYLNLLNDSHWQYAFADHPIDALLAEHVWEHLTFEEGRRAAAQCYKYLKPGGYLRVAVPDGQNPNPDYLEFVRPGGSGPGADDHKTLHTLQSLRELLESVGFAVEPLEYYDADGRFHAAKWDPQAGRIHRHQGWTETLPGGRVLPYTSLIVDARKKSRALPTR